MREEPAPLHTLESFDLGYGSVEDESEADKAVEDMCHEDKDKTKAEEKAVKDMLLKDENKAEEKAVKEEDETEDEEKAIEDMPLKDKNEAEEKATD